MSAVTLHRIDAARHMSRFYRLDVQPDLFGQWCCIREWGRIGRGGQMRETPYPTPTEAEAALERQRQAKERRGYTLLVMRNPGESLHLNSTVSRIIAAKSFANSMHYSS